jgi:hypothetical protein
MHPDTKAAKAMRFYEIHGVEPDDRVFACVVMDCAGDDHAIRIAGEYAAKWKSAVGLYETPDINLSSVDSFNLWPDQMRLANPSSSRHR